MTNGESVLQHIPWGCIENELPHARPTSEGFSRAFKGILTLNGEQDVFVKVATDSETSEWVGHEVRIYEFLRKAGYPYMPNLLSVAPGQVGFAAEALVADDGWSWPDQWTDASLVAALEATDHLNSLGLKDNSGNLITGVRILNNSKAGWARLRNSDTLRQKLFEALQGRQPEGMVLDTEFIAGMAEKEADFEFRRDSLVHYDVRSYNCAWSEDEGIKLIDFDAIRVGDSRIAQAFILGDASGDGIDVLSQHRSRLDRSALEWVTGFWLANSCNEGIDPRNRENKIRRSLATLSLCLKL